METQNLTQDQEKTLDAQIVLSEARIIVTESQTNPTRPGKQPRTVWTITGNIKPYQHLIYQVSGSPRRYKGVISCWEDPTDELAQLIQQEGKMTFAEQKEYEAQRSEARADRLEERANKHQQTADTAYRVQHQLSQAIPAGQPILVDHYSAKRHRRHLEQIDNNMRKFVNESDYAQHLSNRADVSRTRAEQDYSIKYLGNRVEEVNKKLREVDQDLNDATDQYKEALLKLRQQYEEELAYWQGLIEEKGGINYSKDTIEVGDWIYKIGWLRVYRVNAKTVSLRYHSHTQRSSNPCKYHEIKGYCSREKAIEYGKKFGVNLDECNDTNLDLTQA
jgi:hypothetical protein